MSNSFFSKCLRDYSPSLLQMLDIHCVVMLIGSSSAFAVVYSLSVIFQRFYSTVWTVDHSHCLWGISSASFFGCVYGLCAFVCVCVCLDVSVYMGHHQESVSPRAGFVMEISTVRIVPMRIPVRQLSVSLQNTPVPMTPPFACHQRRSATARPTVLTSLTKGLSVVIRRDIICSTPYCLIP